MIWLAVAAVTVPFVALMFWIAHDIGVMIAATREREERGCTCTRYRLCAACLAELREAA